MMQEYEKFREGNRLEAKKAADALPRNIWETYSAFANTNGVVILLGVEELSDKSLCVCGVTDAEKLIVVVRETERLSFANPGSCRLDPEMAKAGGISEPRNEILMKMFNFIDVGERAGSGIFNIFHAWENLGMKAPVLTESFSPDRLQVTLDLGGIEAVIAKLKAKKSSERSSEKDQSPTINPSLTACCIKQNPSFIRKSSVKSSVKGSVKGLERSSEKSSERSSEKSSEKSSERSSERILSLIHQNPQITTAMLAQVLEVSTRAVAKQLATLQTQNILKWIDGRRYGHWEILDGNFKELGL